MSDYVDDVPPEDPYADGPAKVDEQAFTEQSVLGAMMISSRACADVLRLLRSADFYVPKHGVIFDAVAKLHRTGAPTDVIAVVDDLVKTGDLHQAGGADYVHGLTSIVPTAANASYYAGIIRDSSTARGLAEIGRRLQTSTGEPGVRLADAQTALQKLRDEVAAGSEDTRVRWLRDVLDVPAEDDAYDWVIPGVLERQDRLMLSAAEGVGKSTLMRQFAVLAAAGIHPFGFTPMPPIRVLIVDAENSERQWRRATRDLAERAVLHGQRDPRANIGLHCVNVMDITGATDLGRVHKWIDEAKPDLLVLGPLYRMANGSLNNDDDVQPVLRALDSLRERDVAMLIEVHAGHARSTSGERELRPRGSSALLGWPEFGLGLRRDKGDFNGRSRYSLVRWRGDRDARSWPRLVRGTQWPWEPTVQL